MANSSANHTNEQLKAQYKGQSLKKWRPLQSLMALRGSKMPFITYMVTLPLVICKYISRGNIKYAHLESYEGSKMEKLKMLFITQEELGRRLSGQEPRDPTPFSGLWALTLMGHRLEHIYTHEIKIRHIKDTRNYSQELKKNDFLFSSLKHVINEYWVKTILEQAI